MTSTTTTSTPDTDRRARPRGPGCSVCAASANACPAPQDCEAPDLLDPTHDYPTPGEQVRGFLLVALGAAVCALLLISMPPTANVPTPIHHQPAKQQP